MPAPSTPGLSGATNGRAIQAITGSPRFRLRAVGLLANSSPRVEPYPTPDAIVPHQ